MDEGRTYTLEEIEKATGFDKRTIAYYVQEGLLPKVGRRGPRTRYSQGYLDRLLFIKKIRNQQDKGRLGNLTLSDIGDMLRYLTEDEIADVVAGRDNLDLSNFELGDNETMPTMAPPRRRMSRLREFRKPGPNPEPSTLELIQSSKMDQSSRDGDMPIVLDVDDGPPVLELREVTAEDGVVSSPPIPPANPPPPRRERLGKLLERLAGVAGSHRDRRGSEHWTRANVTADITVSARNLDDEGAQLLEEIARSLRWKLLRSRRSSKK